jgi:F-type H+-transporting ATPase subunit gamma
MAGAKEIRTKIVSVKKTQKITRAMEMVAASKMRKTQERMRRSRPYATKINAVVQHVAKSHSEYQHSYLSQRDIKRVGLVVITTDRGLCGSLNVNLFKEAIHHMKEWQGKNISVDLCVVGRKGEAFFKRTGGNVVAFADQLGDAPTVSDIIGVVQVMLNAYDKGEIDALYITYNKFVNTMTQKPEVQQLLPIQQSENEAVDHYWDYIYEPDAKPLLDSLFERYIELQVYQGLVENIACEQAAKMIAMKNASDNAGDLIKGFQLAYNKARQAAITQELAEIVSGASAL